MNYYSWPNRVNGSVPTQRPAKKNSKTTAPEAPPVDVNDVDTKITPMRLLRTSLNYQTKEFFNNSTLHGVRYIGEKERPFGERLMWFSFTTIGLISALVIIASLWEKFQTNPTITGLDMDVHNQQLVFPTVVVCPIESYDLNRTYDLAYYKLGNYEEDSTEIFEPFLIYLPQMSYENLHSAYAQSSNISTHKKYKNAMDTRTLRSYTFQIAILCNETFDLCKYRDEDVKCCDHFYPVYSEHGFCFAFNPRYIDEPNAEITNKRLHELFETDKKWALFFTPKREAKIFVHSHDENFGWDFRPHVIWEPDFAAELLISMKQTYTTEDARQLSISQRKCIFPDEVKLQEYEGEYTFTSCMKECRMRKSMKLCKCIPPFYRPIKAMPYCNLKDLECLSKFAINITDVRDCSKCELSCANTVYEIEKLSKTTADPSKPLDTYVNIEYLTWPIIRYKREVLFGWVDLLVSFGGIAGLFLGFSLLSGVEILYYFSLRACCMLYKNREELYELAEIQMQEPIEYIDLSLTIMKRTKIYSSDDELPAVRQIDVAEISSRVASDQLAANPDPIENDKGMPNHLTRKKQQMIQTMLQANRVANSYDYAQATGPYYYMP